VAHRLVTLSALCFVARFDSYQAVKAKGEGKPMRKPLRWRFWLETGMAIVTSILFVITLVQRDWIEVVFGVNPDSRSGILEWLIVAALLVVTITLFTLASYEWCRARVAIS
jgi:hypothetical protein